MGRWEHALLEVLSARPPSKSEIGRLSSRIVPTNDSEVRHVRPVFPLHNNVDLSGCTGGAEPCLGMKGRRRATPQAFLFRQLS